MPQKPRVYVSLTPTSEKLLEELIGGRLSPFKKATLATFALERGLMMMACPTALPEQIGTAVP